MGCYLIGLHVGFETAAPYPLKRVDVKDEKARKAGVAPKPVLKSDRETGEVVIDSETTLTGVPAPAWTYMVGNRCAIDWVLDQHKEGARRTAIGASGVKAFQFADHKEKVIDLARHDGEHRNHEDC
jgi:predicted helicase